MLRIGMLTALILFGTAAGGATQEPAKKPENVSPTAQVRKTLEKNLEVPEEFKQQPTPLRLVLKFFHDKLSYYGLDFPILIHQAAFQIEHPEAPDFLDELVHLRGKPRPLRELLDDVVDHFAKYKMTHIVKDGRIVITTTTAASTEALLDHSVAMHLRDVPLKTALAELADVTGLKIVPDPSGGEVFAKRVSLDSHNDVTARGILNSWAEVVDLKVIVEPKQVLLVPRAEHLKRLRHQASVSGRTETIRNALKESIDVPEEFKGQPVQLRLVLEFLHRVLRSRNLDIEISIDQGSFRVGDQEAPDVKDQNVTMPTFIRKATFQQMLETALEQWPGGNATYLIKNGRVEIRAKTKDGLLPLLAEKYGFDFRDVPLAAALRELGDTAGVTIVVDPRIDGARTVRLQTQKDKSVRDLLQSWAKEFDLALIIEENRVLLMPRAEYQKKLADEEEEVKLLSKIPGKRAAAP